MKLLDELAEVFLNGNDDEMSYVLNSRTGEILLDAPEALTGEPEIDWDDEEVTADLVMIPNVSSSEMYDVMASFAKKQSDPITIHLINVLNGKKPFRMFKEKINELGVENHWYQFEQDYAKSRMTEWLEELSEIEVR
ncbi:hypothetical protein AMS59_13545 [Lysinibacillus sp. FJAT-14745]|uniref:UPF0158 family protein n=1 Tax=Lysinibacillus sp. FJAT-14745 TaxID=1704289 RepID=UPI0006ABA718|nr:UPF0158 family protein [Lysinibacillus sp. FJAT-14745]KOP78123.1 hypothetical protein AMS59_13545 [Lysinibacillus sp. FJAT-14745]